MSTLTPIEILREANKKNEELLAEYNASKADRASKEDVVDMIKNIKNLVDVYNTVGTLYADVVKEANTCKAELEKLHNQSDDDVKAKDMQIKELEETLKNKIAVLDETNILAIKTQQQADQCFENLKNTENSILTKQQLETISQVLPKPATALVVSTVDTVDTVDTQDVSAMSEETNKRTRDESKSPENYKTPRTSRPPSSDDISAQDSSPSASSSVELIQKPEYLNNYDVDKVGKWSNATADKYIKEIAKNPNASKLKQNASLDEKRDYIRKEMARLAWR
jgi:soluble P-type ATPase